MCTGLRRSSILAIAWTILLVVTSTTCEECTGVYTSYIVVDGSQSINADNFELLKIALKTFITQSITGNSAVRIGIVVYSDDVTDVIPAASNITILTHQIDSVLYPQRGTATHFGIDRARELLRDPSSNPRVMIVMTDGVSSESNRTSQAAAQAKEAGITMIAVGIDEVVKPYLSIYKRYLSEIQNIASSNSMVFQIRTFKGLEDDIMDIVQMLCSSQVMIAAGLSEITASLGTSSVIRVILSHANVTNGIWTKEGTDLTSDTRYVIDTEGNTQTLTILNVTLWESGEYTYTIGNTSTRANLTVIVPSTASTITTTNASVTTTKTEITTLTANAITTMVTQDITEETDTQSSTTAPTPSNDLSTGGGDENLNLVVVIVVISVALVVIVVGVLVAMRKSKRRSS